MKRILLITNLMVISLFLLITVTPVSANVSELIGLLTKNLGVTEAQAKGGAAAIFDQVKQEVSAEDFSTVTKALPGVDSLAKSAPKTGGLSGNVGGLSSAFGSTSSSLGGMAALAESFSKLGLDTEMVGKYTKIILDFAQSKGGKEVMNIIKSALL